MSATPSAAKPMIFAIMRNGHEVIRGAITEIVDFMENNKFEEAKEVWKKLSRWGELHMKMEEGSESGESPIGMFRLLDQKCDNVVTKNNLHDRHVQLVEYEKAVSDAFEQNNWEGVKASFPAFQKENLDHLVLEEDIMMPNVQKLAKSGEPVKKFMVQEILATIGTETEDYEFFVRYANEVLERHSTKDKPKLRVFDHALWAVATPEQWTVWDSWIKDSVSPASYEELQNAIQAFKAEQAQKKAETPADKSKPEEAASSVEVNQSTCGCVIL